MQSLMRLSVLFDAKNLRAVALTVIFRYKKDLQCSAFENFFFILGFASSFFSALTVVAFLQRLFFAVCAVEYMNSLKLFALLQLIIIYCMLLYTLYHDCYISLDKWFLSKFVLTLNPTFISVCR